MANFFKNIRPCLYALIMILIAAGTAGALTIKGIDFTDEMTLARKKLYLNGAGIKKSFFKTSYACALYLPHPTSDAEKAIKVDSCKQIVMHFKNSFSKEKIVEIWDSGFFNNSQEKLNTLHERISTFNSFFSKDLNANDRITFSYIPGLGTSIKINNETRGTIPSNDFMQAFWSVWLGNNPVDGNIKDGILGK
ncbi:chalcone isomerase family protein [bacterium]|nr:chalcone isomerase family protein [bacterium]